MSSRKVKSAWLQTPVDIPGLPGATTQLSPTKTPRVKLELTELGLELTQGDVKAFIPVANVKAVIFDNEQLNVSNTEAEPARE